MSQNPETLMPTVGAIAKRLGVPIHRVEYVIRTQGIDPEQWAGNARVFSEHSVAAIAAHLDRIERAKQLRQEVTHAP